MIEVDGFQIETTPGALVTLDCGENLGLEGLVLVGDPVDCPGTGECGEPHEAFVTKVLPVEIAPIVTVPAAPGD